MATAQHAAVRVEAHDRKRLEHLCRQITRPALSDERVQLNAAVWRIGWVNMALTVAVSVLFFLAPRESVGLFTEEPAVVAIGAE